MEDCVLYSVVFINDVVVVTRSCVGGPPPFLLFVFVSLGSFVPFTRNF